MPVNLPTNFLRSFVAVVDTGTMKNASEHVYVTQSALSLQIRRLEDLLQRQLFVRGARLTLTPAGKLLLDYARRILKLHDEAISAVSVGKVVGPTRVGMVQDFADTLLGGLLSRFAELHPDSQIYARVAGTVELQELLQQREIDVVVGFGDPDHPAAIAVAPMSWYGDPELLERSVIPLAVLDKPCCFRDAAIMSLAENGIPYRIAVETPNLATLRAAVDARLGITCRTHIFRPHMERLDERKLPALPQIAAIVQTNGKLGDAAQGLTELAREMVRTL